MMYFLNGFLVHAIILSFRIMSAYYRDGVLRKRIHVNILHFVLLFG